MALVPWPGARTPASPPGTGVRAERRATAPAQGGADVLRVVPLEDAVVQRVGFHPRSEYVEQFWLPVLGPTATWLVRRLSDAIEAAGGACELDLAELAGSLGLGTADGRHPSLRRAMARCARFGVVEGPRGGVLAVRRAIAPLPRRHLLRLPPALQVRHQRWDVLRSSASATEARRMEARLLALDLVRLGQEHPGVERRLVGWGVHPAVAHEAASWARARHRPPEGPGGQPCSR